MRAARKFPRIDRSRYGDGTVTTEIRWRMRQRIWQRH